jgi:hypothetical protein
LGPEKNPTRVIAGVLENTDSSRGFRLGGAVAITEISRFAPTEAFRIPDNVIRKES